MTRTPRIAYISTFVPKRCGLATYTHHLREAVLLAKGKRREGGFPAAVPPPDPVVCLCHAEETGQYSLPWQIPLVKQRREDYRAIAQRINASSVDVVSLQHEFGIFGGVAGEYVLELLRHLEKPVVTTFHTVFAQPSPPHTDVQREIAALSSHLLVMNRLAIDDLRGQLRVPAWKISYIPHGAPVPPQEDRTRKRREYGWDGRRVIFQFGLLSRNKGVELVLRALTRVVREVPDLLYVVAGQTHPEVLRHEGEAYRDELKALVAELGLSGYVRMIDRYIPEEELVSLILAADLYVTPYPGMQQITSGTLAYAAGLGKPILSTPYLYARELLKGDEEWLVPYGDVSAWSRKLIELFTQPERLSACAGRMAEIGRDMQWPIVGERHLELFTRMIRTDALSERRKAVDVG